MKLKFKIACLCVLTALPVICLADKAYAMAQPPKISIPNVDVKKLQQQLQQLEGKFKTQEDNIKRREECILQIIKTCKTADTNFTKSINTLSFDLYKLTDDFNLSLESMRTMKSNHEKLDSKFNSLYKITNSDLETYETRIQAIETLFDQEKTLQGQLPDILRSHDQRLLKIQESYDQRLCEIQESYDQRLLEIQRNYGQQLQEHEESIQALKAQIDELKRSNKAISIACSKLEQQNRDMQDLQMQIGKPQQKNLSLCKQIAEDDPKIIPFKDTLEFLQQNTDFVVEGEDKINIGKILRSPEKSKCGSINPFEDKVIYHCSKGKKNSSAGTISIFAAGPSGHSISSDDLQYLCCARHVGPTTYKILPETLAPGVSISDLSNIGNVEISLS